MALNLKFSKILFAGAFALSLSACASIIPEGTVRGPSSQGGSVPAPTAPPPFPNTQNVPPPSSGTSVTPAVAIDPIDEGQLAKSGEDGTAASAGVALGPDIALLNIDQPRAAAALRSYVISCSSLSRRTDNSGLTRGSDWSASCDAAKSWNPSDANRFFETYFEAVQVGDGKAFATGYYEPQIEGSRRKISGYSVPVYSRPSDLVDVDLGEFSDELKGKKIRGRVDGTKVVPFYDRAEIDRGALDGRGLEIAYAKDYIDFFVLQIQGSGRLLAPDGSVMRIGYASQNGRSYTGIGKLMRERGLLADGKTNMAGITEWLRANPSEGQKIMEENKSYIFFNELTGPNAQIGPLGAMGHPVIGRVSVAADRNYVPLGAPVFLNMEHDIADGLWVAQDTGGAIKGSNRFDTFWGAGEEAKSIAGGMSSRGQALIFLPKGTVARLSGN